MKRIFAIFAGLMLTLATLPADAKGKIETVIFSTRLHCDKCVEKVVENISFEKGVKNLEVSLENQTIKIDYDASKTDTLKLADAIRKLGYEAKQTNTNNNK